jgi:hypothetical protein
VHFFDPDGAEFYRHKFMDTTALDPAFRKAQEKYLPRPITWIPNPVAAGERVQVLALLDDEKNSQRVLEALEHPWTARLHPRVDFHRADPVRDAAVLKDLGLSEAPALVIFEAGAEEAPKRVVATLKGRRPLPSIHQALIRALEKSSKR